VIVAVASSPLPLAEPPADPLNPFLAPKLTPPANNDSPTPEEVDADENLLQVTGLPSQVPGSCPPGMSSWLVTNLIGSCFKHTWWWWWSNWCKSSWFAFWGFLEFLENFPNFSFSSKLGFFLDLEFESVLDVILEVDDDDNSSWPSRWCFLLVIVVIDISDTFLSFPEAEEEEEAADVDEEEGGDDEEDDAEAGVSETPPWRGG
jgi:hypothetical protein